MLHCMHHVCRVRDKDGRDYFPTVRSAVDAAVAFRCRHVPSGKVRWC
jgi:hypothetical protein